jgi:hypothetical protein
VASQFIRHPLTAGWVTTETSLLFETGFSHHHNFPSADPSSPRAPPTAC